MKVYLIRHSEPDYSQVRAAGYAGFGVDLAGLTPHDVQISQECAKNAIFREVQVLVSSPYTRALQTAAEIVRRNNIPLHVELGLHEWRPDKTGICQHTRADADAAFKEYHDHHGLHASDDHWDYETSTEVKDRMSAALAKYSRYDCIACVTHGEAMRQFGDWQRIDYCAIKEIEFF
ncbi:histidine phosphatase family protein [Schleiferilactobacillus perolens]|uniref:Phosphoglycerate mutase family protein n=1 Tax=Schleiferilactobacillus perolens DSM 12744 TaxID=1423792 RepID=A0A0R1N255_9LACO|nr:histidine phosphatase family protein [Schleiferilactobacillus perolens]KRL12420.1 hypothetical protein FD09_GL003003 [Schleiferilactobacillus perolens DSM 12744]